MKQKLGILALAVFFLLTSAVTGTLAIQVRAASGNTEVQTTGAGVDIENILAQRGTALTTLAAPSTHEFTMQLVADNEPLYVAVTDANFDWKPTQTLTWTDTDHVSKLWRDDQVKNAVDRFLMVENTGGQPVYIRTIYAFEADTTGFSGTLIHMNRNETDYTWETIPGVTIEGVKYDLYVATYNFELAAGKRTPPSLLQIAMDTGADNKEVMQFGEEYEIKIWSQAVSKDIGDNAAEALKDAFGTISAEKHPWVNSTN